MIRGADGRPDTGFLFWSVLGTIVGIVLAIVGRGMTSSTPVGVEPAGERFTAEYKGGSRLMFVTDTKTGKAYLCVYHGGIIEVAP